MPLRDLLTFGNRKSPFEGWPPAPKAGSVSAGKRREKDPSPAQAARSDGQPYFSTLIICLGESGESSLRFLAEKIAQSGATSKGNLRALLIKEKPAYLELDKEWPIRVLELQRSSTLFIPKGAAQSLRFDSLLLFQQAANYRRYQEWIQESLLDLGGDTQVFICGSLAEPIIGLLGEALQILRNFPESLGRANLFSRVVALLSLQSSASNSLPAEEVFACCREIGRLSFPGPHVMNTSYGMNRVVRSALLDALFILEEPGFRKTATSKGDGSQLIAESLFTLIHPSARNIWENLRNDLPISGRIRHDSHQAVVHGVGTATLYIPLRPIKDYVAARLAFAAIYGERANASEGIAHQSLAPAEAASVLARRFLTNGSYDHPVFDWMLRADSPSYFEEVPDLSSDFITAFQFQVSQNLLRTLNQIPANTAHICLALEWLEKHLIQCESWFRMSKPSNVHAPARGNFQYVLTKWRDTIQALLKELRGWHQVLFPTEQARAAAPNTNLAPGWRSSSTKSGWRMSQTTDAVDAPKDIAGILKSYRKNEEESLMRSFSDQVYRSVISDSTGSLQELESYYADTVRPELLRFSNEPSSSFTRVRDRMEWWVQLTPEHVPQLYMVFWPSQATVNPEPPLQYCFRSDQAQDFADAVFNFAFSQTAALESDLTRSWFHQRVKLFVDFLRRASEAYLRYDQNVANAVQNAASRRSYLIANDPTILKDFVPHVFSDTPRFEINELDSGDPTRLTAMSLRLNIPFSALTAFQEMRRDYLEKSPEKIHLYVQEQTAATYERRIWKLEHMREFLSSDFVTLLTEQQLVTLFCQGLLTGVIGVKYDEDNNQRCWKVAASESFPELELAPASEDGLLAAFRQFVLELPNEQDLNQNPQKHFYPARRQQYIAALTRQVKSAAIRPQARAIREGLKEELERWKRKGEHDDLARSFSIILQCEWDEPVWKDW